MTSTPLHIAANSAHFTPLDERQRFIYLKAMGITVWVPRAPLEYDNLSDTNQFHPAAISQPQASLSETDQIDADQFESSPLECNQFDSSQIQSGQNKSGQIESSQIDAEILSRPPTTREVFAQLEPHAIEPQAIEAPAIETTKDKTTADEPLIGEATLNEQAAIKATAKEPTPTNQKATRHFLKRVNWRSSENGSQKVLIICRHHRDQPAQSFARANSPSQFMADYIGAIAALSGPNSDIQIELAHLTEAGLGHDNAPMEQVVSQINPDLILLLGDESLVHLFDHKASVANYRGKMLSIAQLTVEPTIKAIASYHPFTLIQNPPLKKLALEDLQALVNILQSHSTG